MLSAILVGLLGNALLAAMGPRDLLLLRDRRAQLEAQRTELIVRKAGLETTVQNLRSNDRYLEHRIRTELGYARPDEMVYKFTADASSDPRQSPPETTRSKTRRSVIAGLTLELLSEIGVVHR